MSAKKLLANLGSRIIDTEHFKSKTNAATGLGATIGTIASVLATMPDPNAQLAAGVLGLVSFALVMYKENKNG